MDDGDRHDGLHACIWGRGKARFSFGEQRNARGHADESEGGSVGEDNRILEEEPDEDESVGGDDNLSEGGP